MILPLYYYYNYSWLTSSNHLYLWLLIGDFFFFTYLDSCYSIISVYLINLFIHLGTHLVLACIAICVCPCNLLNYYKKKKKKKKKRPVAVNLASLATAVCTVAVHDRSNTTTASSRWSNPKEEQILQVQGQMPQESERQVRGWHLHSRGIHRASQQMDGIFVSCVDIVYPCMGFRLPSLSSLKSSPLLHSPLASFIQHELSLINFHFTFSTLILAFAYLLL